MEIDVIPHHTTLRLPLDCQGSKLHRRVRTPTGSHPDAPPRVINQRPPMRVEDWFKPTRDSWFAGLLFFLNQTSWQEWVAAPWQVLEMAGLKGRCTGAGEWGWVSLDIRNEEFKSAAEPRPTVDWSQSKTEVPIQFRFTLYMEVQCGWHNMHVPLWAKKRHRLGHYWSCRPKRPKWGQITAC